jgi:hypothetical protein
VLDWVAVVVSVVMAMPVVCVGVARGRCRRGMTAVVVMAVVVSMRVVMVVVMRVCHGVSVCVVCGAAMELMCLP